MPAAGSLPDDTECGVVVIGSGIAGISTAYEFGKRGKSVVVIERGKISVPALRAFCALCDDLVSEMSKINGKDATKLFCDSQAAAVDRMEEIQKTDEI